MFWFCCGNVIWFVCCCGLLSIGCWLFCIVMGLFWLEFIGGGCILFLEVWFEKVSFVGGCVGLLLVGWFLLKFILLKLN